MTYRRIRLLGVLLLVISVNLPRLTGAQGSSVQPVVTPATNLDSSSGDPSNQTQRAASPAPSPLSPVPTQIDPSSLGGDKIVRIKIFLDQRSFGPGEIDDHWSDLAANALRSYQRATGSKATGQIDPQLDQQLAGLTPVYVTYQIRSDDSAWVGKSPQKPAAQAKRKLMPYPSVADFVAERFHTSVSFLTSLNRGKNLNGLRSGDSVQVPAVSPMEVSQLKRADDIPPRPELKTRSIEIDTKSKVLTILEGEKILSAFPITPGSKALPAPIGTWQIVKITTLPWFRWDKAMLLHGTRSGDFYTIPPGPRNEVGLVWIGLNKKGIGIHGTNNPSSIGRSASHGCIRLANWDALRVLDSVTQGATVVIK
jgi:lipoprotein-anchoring transpeptidase ErfK/SrfK